MNIADLAKAICMLSDQQLINEVKKIEFGIFTMSDGTEYYLEDLVEAYDKEYGDE